MASIDKRIQTQMDLFIRKVDVMEERYKKQFLESGVPQLAETLRSSKLSVLPKEKLEKLDNLAARAVAELKRMSRN